MIKFNDLLLLFNNNSLPLDEIKKVISSTFEYFGTDPNNENHILICRSYESLESALKTTDTYSCCHIYLETAGIQFFLNTFEDLQKKGIKFIIWLFNNYKNQIIEILDDWGHDWLEQAKTKGIESIFE